MIVVKRLILNILIKPTLLYTCPFYSFTTTLPPEQKQGLTKLQRYLKIKQRNKQRKQQQKMRKSLQLSKKLQQESQHVTAKNIRCQGCSVQLQTTRIDKYGFIQDKTLAEYLLHNKKILEYNFNSTQQTDNTIKIIRDIQEEFNIQILKKNSFQIAEIDNVQAVLALEERLEQDRKQRQVLPKNPRKEIYCRRCFYLKNHNRLPDQHNRIDIEQQTDILTKIFNRSKQETFFMYLVDIFDLCGTLTQPVITKLLMSGMKFNIIISKFDLVNRKYFDFMKVKPFVRMEIVKVVDKLKKQKKLDIAYKLEEHLEEILFVSNESNVGINKLKKKLQNFATPVQLIGYPNTGKTSLLNTLTSSRKPTSSIPGTSISFEFSKYNRTKIFDCPGIHNSSSLYNLITTPNQKSLLTWKQYKFAPGILTNNVIFYGGMIESEGVRVVVFGNGGAKTVKEENLAKWLIANYEQFWKGLPEIHLLKIKKYSLNLSFKEGVTDDIEISGYGFISLRLCKTGPKISKLEKKTINLYLPESVEYRLRPSFLKDQQVHKASSISKRFRLERVHPR